jgi:hypothetical protein
MGYERERFHAIKPGAEIEKMGESNPGESRNGGL